MLRRIAIAMLVPVGLAGVAAYGCGGNSEPPIEDLCGWLAYPDNCYRQFHEDVGSQCIPTHESEGTFLSRMMLDTCVFPGGGQVVFNPPLDVTKFPPTGVGFAMNDALGNECGQGTFNDQYDFSVTIDPPVDAGASSGSGGSGGGSVPRTVDGGAFSGGTFSSVTTADRNLLDVSCPAADTFDLAVNDAAPNEAATHHFNSLYISRCPFYSQVLPQAELLANPGSVGLAGFVTFRVNYPPGSRGDRFYTSPNDALDAGTLPPDVVEYFTCKIPAAPPLCEDGVQDGNETGIDCGGDCTTKCPAGMGCMSTTDCAAGTQCLAPMGIKVCTPPTTGAGGAGGVGGAGTGSH